MKRNGMGYRAVAVQRREGGEGGWVYRVAIRLVPASPNRLIRSQRFTNAKTVRPRYKPSKYRYSTTVIGSGRAIINSRTRHDLIARYLIRRRRRCLPFPAPSTSVSREDTPREI